MSNTTIGGNIKLFDNTIQTTQSNANLELNPSGSGSVNVTSGMTTAAITTSANVSITGTETITGQLDVEGVTIKDNTISTNASNAHLEISGNGSGNVVIDDVDIGGGFIDNVVIGGVTPAAGTFTAFTTPTLSSAGITITDNVIKTNSSNANLEFSASGSGYVVINGFQLPNADGGTGQVLRTDGSTGLTWVTSPILLGASDIQDGTATVGFSTETVVDPNVSTGKHESITTTASTINEYASTKYDSTFWIALTRMEAADSSVEFALAKYSLLHGTPDGSSFDSFITHSSIVRTGEEYSFDDSTRLGMDEHIKTSTDIASNNVRLKGQGGYLADGSTISSTNAISFYRIGLGDDDS